MENLETHAEEKLQDVKDATEEPVEEVKESPLAEAKRIEASNKDMLKEIKEERARLDEIVGELKISGRAEGGKIVKKETQEDLDKIEIDKRLAQFNPEP